MPVRRQESTGLRLAGRVTTITNLPYIRASIPDKTRRRLRLSLLIGVRLSVGSRARHRLPRLAKPTIAHRPVVRHPAMATSPRGRRREEDSRVDMVDTRIRPSISLSQGKSGEGRTAPPRRIFSKPSPSRNPSSSQTDTIHHHLRDLRITPTPLLLLLLPRRTASDACPCKIPDSTSFSSPCSAPRRPPLPMAIISSSPEVRFPFL